ncbi:enoyl-CoA hydratase-related protein [Actinomadura parmotrematis]|uniref:Enoyl-CoA hydratase/isomerase family protein n=1 Tax=Actinomadura parmotrematis TaxID=2864039 RepID=A0ABS7FN01_9ACTN|nr:enoyl-CoA hydratase-related protein [Actinomadura parmotrematis]MBW8481365.1 enoyl-CoA hydratase/isomerase family protein [Actinomadura parmotrematis]
MAETVQYALDRGVAIITLDRPAAMNALDDPTKDALRAAVERAAADPAARAVLITGAGRAFCAGQDLQGHAGHLRDGRGLNGTVREHYNPVVLGIAAMRKPVVAAVNGVAAGAGMGLALACDLVVAADGASFVPAFGGVGLAPDSGVSWTLQRLVGRARATEILLLGERITAPRALEIGMIARVVPAGELAGTALELAARLAAGPTAAYGLTKDALAFAAGSDLAAALEREAELQEDAAATADHRGAVEAFLAKERPAFQGR